MISERSKGKKWKKLFAVSVNRICSLLRKKKLSILITWIVFWTRARFLFLGTRRWTRRRAGWRTSWIVAGWFQVKCCAIRLELEIFQLANVVEWRNHFLVMFARRVWLVSFVTVAVLPYLHNSCHRSTKATSQFCGLTQHFSTNFKFCDWF